MISFTIESEGIKYWGMTNQGGIRPVLRKLQWKKLTEDIEDDIEGKIYHAHRLEELILLKGLYFPMAISVALQIQCNPCQNTSSIFHRTRTNNSKNCVEILQSQTAKHNLEKEEHSWSYQALWFQTIAQSYCPQNSMVLTWKETQRSMEQNRVQKRTQLQWLINLPQRRQEYTARKRQPLL